MKRMKMRICAMLIVLLTLAAAHGVAATNRPAAESKIVPAIGDRVYLNPTVYYNEENTTPSGRYFWTTSLSPYHGNGVKSSSEPQHGTGSNNNYKITVNRYDVANSILAPAYSTLSFKITAKMGAQFWGKTIGKTIGVGISDVFSGGNLFVGPGATTNATLVKTKEKDKMLTTSYAFPDVYVLDNSEGSAPAYGSESNNYALYTFADMEASILKSQMKTGESGDNYAYITVTDIENYIRYYKNDGSEEGKKAFYSQTKKGNKSITLSKNQLTKAGAVHVGWNTKPDGSGKHYDFGATYSGTSGMQLYAEWKHSYTLTFDYNYKSKPANQNRTVIDRSSDNNNVSDLKRVRDGYEFKGWYTDPHVGTMVYGADGKCNNASAYWEKGQWTGNSSMTLYARWTGFRKVTLDKQGGTGGTDAYWYKYNENSPVAGTDIIYYYYDDDACTVPHMLDKDDSASTYKFRIPQKDGYVFQGYYIQPNGGGEYYIDAQGVGQHNIYTAFDEDVTLYAYWTKQGVEPISVITQHPEGVTKPYEPNDSLTLSVGTNSSDTFSYQWKKNGVDIPGATGKTYTIDPLTVCDDEYVCVVRASGNGEQVSNVAKVVVSKAEPIITWPDVRSTIYVNDELTYSGGSSNAEGTFDFDGPTTWADAGKKTTYLTFTPKDTQNYYVPTPQKKEITVSKRNVTLVETLTAITKEYGTPLAKLDLPQTIEITTQDSKTFAVPVTWSTYNPEQIGDQTLTGTLDPEGMFDNELLWPSSEKKASIKVTLTAIMPDVSDWTTKEVFYSGQGVSHEIEGSIPGVASVTYTYQKIIVKSEEDAEYIDLAEGKLPTDAGDYLVKAVFTTTLNDQYVDNIPAEYSQLVIKKTPLVVEANDHTITYGDAPANGGVSCDGFVSGEDASDLSALTYSYSYTQYGDVGTYTITPSAAADNYEITCKSGTLTVNQKEIGIEWSNLEPVYTGQKLKPTATATGVVSSDVLGLTVAGEKTDVGQYTANVTAITGEKAGNYVLPADVTTTFRIKNAEQSAPALTGEDAIAGVAETISKKGDGKIAGVTEAMEWRAKGTVSFASVETDKRIIENLAAGTYEVRYAEKPNYNASPVTEITIAAGRKLKLTVPASQVGYSLEAKLGSGSFTKDAIEFDWEDDLELQFTLGAGYSLRDNFSIKNNGNIITLTDKDNSGRTKTAILENVREDAQLQVTGVADITAPEMVEITIVEEPTLVSRMMKSLSFNDFHQKNLIVTIKAQDLGSGLNDRSIEYSVKNQETDYTSITDWQTYTSPLKLEDDNPYVIYARVTDNDGNVAYCDSEKGVVIDKTPPTVKVIQNGSECEIEIPDDPADKPTYYGDTRFRVTDTNLDYVTLDGKRVTLDADGYFTIPEDPKENREHEIVAWDKAGNSTTVKVWIYKIYTVIFIADGTEVHSVKVNHGWDTPMIDVPHSYGEGEKLAYWDHDGKNITKDTTITAVYFDGELKDVTVPKENFGGAVIENTLKELLAAVPISTDGDPSERFMIDHGADLKVWIATTDITENVPEQDRKLLEEMARKLGNKNHIYLDISMFKQIGSQPEVKITKLNKPIKLIQHVPQMRLISNGNHVRTYQLVRVHEGVAEEIPMKFDPETATLTFETDRFSTYALLWKDTFIPSTGDRSNLMLSMAMLLVSCALLLGVRKKTGKAV